jgi:hypothetical protein
MLIIDNISLIRYTDFIPTVEQILKGVKFIDKALQIAIKIFSYHRLIKI